MLQRRQSIVDGANRECSSAVVGYAYLCNAICCCFCTVLWGLYVSETACKICWTGNGSGNRISFLVGSTVHVTYLVEIRVSRCLPAVC